MSGFQFEDDKSTNDNTANPKSNQDRDLGMKPRGSQRENPPRRSITGINRMNASMSRSRLSEVLAQTRAKYEELLNDPNHTVDPERHKVLVFDREKQQAPYSGIIHTITDVDSQNRPCVAYFFVMLAGSSDVEEFNTKKIDGLEVNVYTSPADTYTANFKRKVLEVVQSNFNMNEDQVIAAGMQVVPKDIKLYLDEDKLKEVAFFSSAALNWVIDALAGEEPFNIEGWINPDTDVIRARVEYNPDPVESAAALPVRSDARITVTATASSDTGHNTLPLAQVDTYVDLVLDQEAVPNAFSGAYQQQNQNIFQRYIPRITLSRMDNLTDVISPETQLLALISSALLARNHLFTGVWRPRKHLSEREDFRNIGAVNYELNMQNEAKPSLIPVKEDSFDDARVFQLIQTVVQPVPIFSIIVEDGNELTWVQRMFLTAATGTGSEKVRAQQAIITAANNLTNGKFTEVFGTDGSRLVEHDGNRLHRGYFVTNGEKRDIREIDHLAMLNLYGGQDMSIVDTFAATFDEVDVDLDVRLDRRRQILIDAVGEVHLHGKGDLLNLDAMFMESLIKAAGEAGLVIDPTNISREFNASPRGRSGMGRFGARFADSTVFSQNPRNFGRGSSSF